MTDRSAYIDKMKAKVDEWTADIEKMQAKAKGTRPMLGLNTTSNWPRCASSATKPRPR